VPDLAAQEAGYSAGLGGRYGAAAAAPSSAPHRQGVALGHQPSAGRQRRHRREPDRTGDQACTPDRGKEDYEHPERGDATVASAAVVEKHLVLEAGCGPDVGRRLRTLRARPGSVVRATGRRPVPIRGGAGR
jgi:hypothetical protein